MADIDVAILTPASVVAAEALSSPGDTLVLPAGTSGDWSSAVTIRYGRNLRGAGKGVTNLIQTSSTNRFFYFNSANTIHSYTVEIEDFTMIGPSGVIDVPTWPTSAGTGYALEIRHSKVNIHDLAVHNKNYGVVSRSCTGCVWDCDFRWIINDYSSSTHGSGGYGVAHGERIGVWPSTYPEFGGTEKVLFVEDCTFYGVKHSTSNGSAGRLVTRYCTIEAGWSHGEIDAHGYRSGNEGSLSTEAYHNTIYMASNGIYEALSHGFGVSIRGGQSVIFNNAIISGGGSSSTDAVFINPIDITEYDGTLARHPAAYVFPDDYPIDWQSRNIYDWGNTYDGVAVDAYESSAWFEENRSSTNSMGTYYDYVNSVKSGYTAYVYPHPLRPTAGGGTYRIEEGAKVVLV